MKLLFLALLGSAALAACSGATSPTSASFMPQGMHRLDSVGGGPVPDTSHLDTPSGPVSHPLDSVGGGPVPLNGVRHRIHSLDSVGREPVKPNDSVGGGPVPVHIHTLDSVGGGPVP